MKLVRSPRLVLLAVVIALFAAGCSSEGNVFSLEVGDCFDDKAVGEVQDVPIVECAAPHDNEIYSVYSLSESFLPEREVMLEGCATRFADAVGIDYDISVIYSGALMPSQDSWDDGDREVVCYGYIPDEKMVETIIGAAK